MDNNPELFDLMSKIYGEMQEGFSKVNGRLDNLENKVDSIENRFDNLEGRFDSIENRFDNLENKVDSIENRFDNLEGRFDNLENKVDNLEGRFDNLENKVDKNTILLEKLDSNIKLVAEVQQGFQEQLGRNLHTDGKTIADRLELIELAVTNGSDNLNDLADNLDVVKNTVGIHEMDLRMMKNKKKHTF